MICAQVEDPNDVVDVGQKVYVKVVEHREANKVSLSMKVVDQATGEDLDPANRDYQARGDGGGGRRGNAPIRAGDEVDPVEAMRKGTADPRNQRFASGGDYELVEDEPMPAPVTAEPIGRGRGATMPAWMQTLKADVGKDLRRKEKKRVARVRTPFRVYSSMSMVRHRAGGRRKKLRNDVKRKRRPRRKLKSGKRSRRSASATRPPTVERTKSRRRCGGRVLRHRRVPVAYLSPFTQEKTSKKERYADAD